MDKRYTRKEISKRIQERMNPTPVKNTAGAINNLIQRAKQLKQSRQGIK